MTRFLLTPAIVFLCAGAALAQHHGNGHGGATSGVHGGPAAAPARPSSVRTFTAPALTPNTYGSVTGFGNVVFPGTGHAPNTFDPFGTSNLGFGSRLSNTVNGFGSPGRNRGGYGYGAGTVIVPYGVPYYVSYPEQQPQAQAPITIVTPPPQIIYVVQGEPGMAAPEPRRDSVITYVVPPREPEPQAAAAPAQKPFLIALKNQSIYTATEYWVEDGTLHYVSPLGAHNQASLDQIDLEFTERLNRERGLEFRLDR